MSLTTILRQHQPAGDAAAVTAWLTANLSIDGEDGRQTFRTLAERFGAEACDTALSALNTMRDMELISPERHSWLVSGLSGDGINLGTTRAKTDLEQMRPLLGDELTDSLLQLGVLEVPRWYTLGLPEAPSQFEVEASIAALETANYNLTATLFSFNEQATGQVSVSVSETPCALVDGEVLSGTTVRGGFTDANPSGARAELVAAIKAAWAAYREAMEA